MTHERQPDHENLDIPTYDLRGSAAYLGVSHETIRRWINDGHLPAQRVGVKGTYRVKQNDLDNMVRTA